MIEHQTGRKVITNYQSAEPIRLKADHHYDQGCASGHLGFCRAEARHFARQSRWMYLNQKNADLYLLRTENRTAEELVQTLLPGLAHLLPPLHLQGDMRGLSSCSSPSKQILDMPTTRHVHVTSPWCNCPIVSPETIVPKSSPASRNHLH